MSGFGSGGFGSGGFETGSAPNPVSVEAHLEASASATAGVVRKVAFTVTLRGEASLLSNGDTFKIYTPVGIEISPVRMEIRDGQHVVTALMALDTLPLGLQLRDASHREWNLHAIEPGPLPGQVRLFLQPLDRRVALYPYKLSYFRPS
jgi:hypothetical protein